MFVNQLENNMLNENGEIIIFLEYIFTSIRDISVRTNYVFMNK